MRPNPIRTKPGFKVFHSLRDIALGASFARTRTTLVLTTLTVTVLYGVYVVFTADYMRHRSGSVILNLVLISGGMLWILVVAYFQTLLVGDLFFPGRWRERVILGRRVEQESDDPKEIRITHFQDYTIPFYLVFLLLLVINYLSYGWFSGGFLSQYHTWRYQHTLLRSEHSQDRIRGIRNITNPREEQAQNTPEIREALIDLLGDRDPQVRLWALWAAGEIKLYEAAQALHRIVADPQEPDEIRARAAEALGWLANREGAQLMANLLPNTMGRNELALGFLRGLGLVRAEETAGAIAPFIHVEPTEIRAHAFWALGRTRNRQYRDVLVRAALEGSDEQRCFAAEGLKFFVNHEDRLDAHTWFASSPQLECQSVVWRLPYHWDEQSSFFMEIVIGESLQAKFLKTIFSAGGVDERNFLVSVIQDPSYSQEVRLLARELVMRIDERR